MTKISIKRKWLLLLVLAVFIAAGLFAWHKLQNQAKETAAPDEQAKVQRKDIVVGLESDGTINFSKVNLQFTIKGTVKEILVKEGDPIKQGDLIARLDSDDYENQYQLAHAKLQDAQQQIKDDKNSRLNSLLTGEASLMKMQSSLETLKAAYAEMERIPDAFAANDMKTKKRDLEIAQKEYDNQVKALDIAREAYERSKSLEQEEISLKIAQQNLDNTRLYAPVSGTMLKLQKKVGEAVNDEQDFAVVHENNEVEMNTKVIEYDVGRLKVGQKVNVTVEALPDKKYTGEVTKIDHLPVTGNESSGLVNYAVVIKLQNADSDLKDGMTAKATFVIKEVLNCLVVPYRAVTVHDGKPFVTLLEQGQKVEREIKTGFTDGTTVEVLDGLRGNETVLYAKKPGGPR
ncbi:efflux RND transporter periplasmic adaptor subunit [Heliobacterium gestii]|uniref:Efflux RND transporter periplasmic adaptor subunit n=1 Tax=Heliomicrobium gestii TaxID=2699 RepID=A0A845LFP5_HELGE|nr:efflux RND transporter periplasmic adaptor subunit [Heliomicrobium gestii]MBM7865409.1 RND family efflux transporter MFP subunit [Heliomicrobium gestii]MZP41666.1 efflux RND transporter periplasmic adaptor subunit [Heliomicrobium gestii]